MARKSARGDEAAAIAAAIARFEAETGGAAAEPAAAAVGPWQRAALLEGIAAKQIVPESEGGEKWLS